MLLRGDRVGGERMNVGRLRRSLTFRLRLGERWRGSGYELSEKEC